MELQQFGPYRIESLLGRGGMGEVYRAFDTEHDRTVALKVLSEHLAADSGYRERFRREAHLAARLNEPHIVPIHRYGEIDGRLFLDMRLVPGRDVAAALAEDGPMSPERAVSIVGQTARALDAAHADGLVHRDVKPSNVLLSGSADDEFVYLVDFGIARSTSDGQGPALTQTGAALGSFDYMAPERFLEKPIDRRVDVYALACVLFECLTGRRPFTGDGLATLMYAHLNTTPVAPSQLRPDLPRALDDVVQKGLAKEPDERYATCGELAAAARAALTSAGVTPRAEAAPPTSVSPLFRPQTVGFSNPGPPGGYGPPSNPGGYGPPSSPGVPAAYGPPSQPGPPGYRPPSHPGAPGYGPPSNPGPPAGFVAPPPGGFRPPTGPVPPHGGGATPSGQKQPNRIPLVLAGLAVLLVLVVVGVIALTSGSGGGGDVADDSSSSSSSSSSSGDTGGGSTGDPASPEEQLRAALPAGFDAASCTTEPLVGDGDLAALRCGPATSQPGPQVAFFYLYEDAAAVDAVFLSDVADVGLAPLTGENGCPGTQGHQPYRDGDGQQAGRVACWVDTEGDANVAWTQDDVGGEAVVSIPGGGETGLADLYAWWRMGEQSDFQTP
ncbi:serine/threonine-protein kinase [Geodermatophilus nigrescens]|uniref:non-specific serine/threonine protein kinase n=1 Tax=Geodermatophilus nigrescens TaxID=1070870 RepID=A0A1M5FNJ5_9ACTN|nr:serine/threonine-protein kinase [Geodermatophilus nigrescens]SHF93004.1 serine/threonine protein kinase [Geodermatophilus nigrescens]